MPMKRLPVRTQATPVVPLPMKGSSTVAPMGTFALSIAQAINSIGFSFGWLDLPYGHKSGESRPVALEAVHATTALHPGQIGITRKRTPQVRILFDPDQGAANRQT